VINPALCTEEEIAAFVRAFYTRVRNDELIGPIFNAHVHDWEHHFVLLTDFWSSVLRGSGRYSGTPMQKHTALEELKPEFFERWLKLFRQTLDEQPNEAMRERATAAAERIAQSLWYGWQMDKYPDRMPTDLPPAA
jgi:hemoglobin